MESFWVVLDFPIVGKLERYDDVCDSEQKDPNCIGRMLTAGVTPRTRPRLWKQILRSYICQWKVFGN